MSDRSNSQISLLSSRLFQHKCSVEKYFNEIIFIIFLENTFQHLACTENERRQKTVGNQWRTPVTGGKFRQTPVI
jgi:hypothetical protein